MADEDETTKETLAESGSPEGQETVEGQPHPLAAGGVRFEEVVSEKNRYKAEADTLRAQVAAFQVAQSQARPAPQAEKVWSTQELQGLVDAGRITLAQMSDQVSIQRSRESEERVVQRLQTERVLDAALAELVGHQAIGKLAIVLDADAILVDLDLVGVERELLGLADVDDIPETVPENVDSGLLGDVTRIE